MTKQKQKNKSQPTKNSRLGKYRASTHFEVGRTVARKIIQKSVAYSLHYPVSFVRSELRRINRWRIPIRKPPQLVRWDLLGVTLSRLWGTINSTPLPKLLRSPIYRAWAYAFRANLDEMKYPIDTYPTLKDFFARPLKEGVRPVVQNGMASPVDGKIVIFGEVTSDMVEQVKGMTYTVSGFLGTPLENIKKKQNTKLYHCVIYLAPGDYHRIHSPDDWTITKRRHFPGTLFPISPKVGMWIPNLLALNERVVLLGERDSGFFSLAAVGAYNVGSITLNFDKVIKIFVSDLWKSLKTNMITRDFRCPNLQYFSWNGVGTHAYQCIYSHPVQVSKGEEIGHFNFGSTVVMLFESEDFEFSVEPGDRILMGQLLGKDKSA